MSKNKNTPQPIVLPPTTLTTSGTVTLNPPDTTKFTRPELIDLRRCTPVFPVAPAEARDLSDRAHDELPQVIETAAAAIRTAAAKGAYSTTISGKSPMIETLADRLTRAGYTTRALQGGVLVQWS